MSVVSIKSGLNKSGDCVLVMSPDLYDMLISECIYIRDGIVAKAKQEGSKDLLHEAASKLTMVIELSTHPKYSEIAKNN